MTRRVLLIMVCALWFAAGIAVGLGIAVYLAMGVMQMDMIYPSGTVWL